MVAVMPDGTSGRVRDATTCALLMGGGRRTNGCLTGPSQQDTTGIPPVPPPLLFSPSFGDSLCSSCGGSLCSSLPGSSWCSSSFGSSWGGSSVPLLPMMTLPPLSVTTQKETDAQVIPVRPKPWSIGTASQALAPPVGSAETSPLPARSTAAQYDADGQATAVMRLLPTTCVIVQALTPPVGSVDVQMCP